MTPHTIPQTVLFRDLFDKPLVATFNQEHASSDGGAVLLKAAERVYGLVKAFARCLADKRAAGKIRHTLADLIGQRIFGIACGHPDGNDADHLADDPIHKLLLGRDPVSGAPLASQPTISRFENGVSRTALYRMGRELAACVIERHRRRLQGRARRVTIDQIGLAGIANVVGAVAPETVKLAEDLLAGVVEQLQIAAVGIRPLPEDQILQRATTVDPAGAALLHGLLDDRLYSDLMYIDCRL